MRSLLSLSLAICIFPSFVFPVSAKLPEKIDEKVECDLLIAGGGFAGAAAAYEGLRMGQIVCMTDITDWVGGQISSQGTSALDEAKTQRKLLHFPEGYRRFRQNIQRFYGKLNPGECWVSESCFIPADGHRLVLQQLQDMAGQSRGKLKWFPNTVIKSLSIKNRLIGSVTAIQHRSNNNRPLNQKPLSYVIEDAYRFSDSSQLSKKTIQFVPKAYSRQTRRAKDWMVIEATETGEIIALSDVPYRLGLDPRSALNPSSPTEKGNPYCTQGFTYPFALERTAEPRSHAQPKFYSQYEPYYGFDPSRRKAYFDLVFTYRRIRSSGQGSLIRVGALRVKEPLPGDISMQNWLWGNDYRPGTSKDNLIYTRQQLTDNGQLEPGNWNGGLRVETLRKAEELSWGFYYWLVAGETDSRLGYGTKKPYPNHRFLAGLESPMGTAHGLSKYPYIRESRRIIGRPSPQHKLGFAIHEIDISAKDYADPVYRMHLSSKLYRQVWQAITFLESLTPLSNTSAYAKAAPITRRTRATVYPDSVGIAHYFMDFHPCMILSPPEKRGNRERQQVRLAHGFSYPAQIPLRAMIPQKIDNLIVTGKNIATSHIAAAAYRVHTFEWSVGAAAGTTAAFALKHGILPYELVDNLTNREPKLEQLRRSLENNGNPTAFPSSGYASENWNEWRVW